MFCVGCRGKYYGSVIESWRTPEVAAAEAEKRRRHDAWAVEVVRERTEQECLDRSAVEAEPSAM